MVKEIIYTFMLLSSMALFGQENDRVTLTAEQSWAIIIRGRLIEGNSSHLKSVNPKIKAKLVELIKGKSFSKYNYNMVTALAYIDDSAAKFMESQIKNITPGVLRNNVWAGLYFDALCQMSSRGVTEAHVILTKMLEPSYWEGMTFRWYPEHIKQDLSSAYYSIVRVWTCYALSGHQDFAKRAKVILENYPQKSDDSYLQLKAYLNLDRIYRELEHRKSGKSTGLATGKVTYTEEFLKKLDAYYVNVVLPLFEKKNFFGNAKDRPVILDQKRSRALMKIPEDKFLQELYSSQETDPDESLFNKEIEQQCDKFFAHIKDCLFSKNYMKIENQILDNGKVVPSHKYKNNKDALIKELDVQREIFFTLKITRHDKTGLQIKKSDLYVKIANRENEWRKLEEITVTFELEGDKNFYKNFFKRTSPSAMRTMSDNGNFQVYMKRINGRWFWNPFGW